MAFPTIYVNTGGSNTNSGSSDNASADVSGTGASCNPSSTTVDLSADSPDLSGVATDGSATIYLADATNSNQKIFRITAVDDGADTVTVDVAPTGNFTASSWAIGGQFLWAQFRLEGSLAAGWTVEFGDSPAPNSGTVMLTARANGDGTDGFVTIRGKSGVDHPNLIVTSSNSVINSNGFTNWHIHNLTLTCQGASADALIATNGWIVEDVIIDDAGDHGADLGGNAVMLGCEFSGADVNGLDCLSDTVAIGCYSHDNGWAGMHVNAAVPDLRILFNILDSNTREGFDNTNTSVADQTHTLLFMWNTIYGNSDSGIEITDADHNVILVGNIFSDNGDVGTDYNVEWLAGSAETFGWHAYNVFHQSGSGGNLSGLTANATESTDDPLFADPANGDFRLQAGSPARAAGFPGEFPGGLSTGYMSMGAVQPKPLFKPLGAGRVKAVM